MLQIVVHHFAAQTGAGTDGLRAAVGVALAQALVDRLDRDGERAVVLALVGSERGRQVSQQQTIVRFRTDHAAEMVQDSEEAEVEPMGRIRCWHDGSQHGPGERLE